MKRKNIERVTLSFPAMTILSIPRGPSVVFIVSTTATQAFILETICDLPWDSSVPSFKRRIVGVYIYDQSRSLPSSSYPPKTPPRDKDLILYYSQIPFLPLCDGVCVSKNLSDHRSDQALLFLTHGRIFLKLKVVVATSARSTKRYLRSYQRTQTFWALHLLFVET